MKSTMTAISTRRGDRMYWYCIMTVYHDSGKMERKLVVDEKTQLPCIVKSLEKPMDRCFTRSSVTTYYTYHNGYKETLECLAAS